VFALKGLSKLDHPQGYWPLILGCWLAAFAVVVVTAFHGSLQRRFTKLSLVVYIAEAAVCAALVHYTFAEGKRGLPYVWLVAAVAFTVAAWIEATRPSPPRRHR
jgi:predicted membrane channel-forming protein YqfA (hemolysin III family)